MDEFVELEQVIDADAYHWLSSQTMGPQYIAAIQAVIDRNVPLDNLHHWMQSNIGPDRAAFALRCKQAARHIRNTMEQ